jgi:cell division protein FtsL
MNKNTYCLLTFVIVLFVSMFLLKLKCSKYTVFENLVALDHTTSQFPYTQLEETMKRIVSLHEDMQNVSAAITIKKNANKLEDQIVALTE